MAVQYGGPGIGSAVCDPVLAARHGGTLLAGILRGYMPAGTLAGETRIHPALCIRSLCIRSLCIRWQSAADARQPRPCGTQSSG
jgi:hypothetical protein